VFLDLLLLLQVVLLLLQHLHVLQLNKRNVVVAFMRLIMYNVLEQEQLRIDVNLMELGLNLQMKLVVYLVLDLIPQMLRLWVVIWVLVTLAIQKYVAVIE
jgi:hypothetical protein